MIRLHKDDIREIVRGVVAELMRILDGPERREHESLDAPSWLPKAQPWMTQKELAAVLRVSLNVVRMWRTTGAGPRWVRIGARPRYARADVAAWLGSLGSREPPSADLLARMQRIRRERIRKESTK